MRRAQFMSCYPKLMCRYFNNKKPWNEKNELLSDADRKHICIPLFGKQTWNEWLLEVRGLASLVNTLCLIKPNEMARWSQRTDMGCRSNPFSTESVKQHSWAFSPQWTLTQQVISVQINSNLLPHIYSPPFEATWPCLETVTLSQWLHFHCCWQKTIKYQSDMNYLTAVNTGTKKDF